MKFNEFKTIAHQGKTHKMQSDRIYNIERNLSVRISYFLWKIFPKIHPNSVSLFSLLVLAVVFGLSFIYWSGAVFVYVGILKLLLLYMITMTDKIDGELARTTGKTTQLGLYYDRAVHFMYPFVFYFTVGHFFLIISGNVIVFYLTLLLGLLTQKQIFFTEAQTMIRDKIISGSLKPVDLRNISIKKSQKRMPVVLRLIDYTTFMLYAWTLFYYLALSVLSLYNFSISYKLYLLHLVISLLVVSYKIFYSYPKYKLFGEDIKQYIHKQD